MVHLCPKYRRSVLINGVGVRLKELIKETCDSLNVEIIEMEIIPEIPGSFFAFGNTIRRNALPELHIYADFVFLCVL